MSHCTCMATGKSFWASGGKKTSTAFFGNGWFPVGGVPTSMICSCKQKPKRWSNHITKVSGKFFSRHYWFLLFNWLYPYLSILLFAMPVNLTFPPACPRTAKQNRVDSSVLPSILNCAKPAACPSMGWDTFLSTEYSCMAPTTRFCWRGEKAHKLGQRPKLPVIYSCIYFFCFALFYWFCNTSASSITETTEVYD